MAYEQRDNSGTLFKNDRKEKDTHPDRNGTAMIDGIEYWVSGWIKTGNKGQFLSLAFKRKQPDHVNPSTERSITQQATAKIKRPNADMDDEIPF